MADGDRITVPVMLIPLLSTANLDVFKDEDIRAVLRKLDDRARRRVCGFCMRVATIGEEKLP
jgi:hypothetical protein